ncbi:MAG: hypothetical protein GX660_10250, partial [Clostridiaceae bacterium]|nr:hypothetical protein [Clostridiaceae bacterium]
VEIKNVKDIYYIQVEAVSRTYCLDVKLKNRSFQNSQMTYDALVREVISEYEADYKDSASQGKTLEKLTLQYQETDWEFLKRMASRFNAGLVPDHVSDKPRFQFGITEVESEGTLEEDNYRVRKNISKYKVLSENSKSGSPKVDVNDFIYYEVDSKDCIMDIGSKLKFRNISLFVYEWQAHIKGGVLNYTYFLAPKNGLSQRLVCNDRIIGLSIEGEVIGVEKDKIKVHLEIDEKQSAGEAWWFLYSTGYTAEGNSGWYCMPELKDHVMVYFPSSREEDAVASCSVRKDTEGSENNKVSNPDIKYFRTKAGKELMFSEKEILISAKDGETFIKLSEDSGIEIYSAKPVKITTKEDLTISAGTNIVITAKDSISLNCQKSKIIMDGATSIIKIEGDEVKTN